MEEYGLLLQQWSISNLIMLLQAIWQALLQRGVDPWTCVPGAADQPPQPDDGPGPAAGGPENAPPNQAVRVARFDNVQLPTHCGNLCQACGRLQCTRSKPGHRHCTCRLCHRRGY